MRHTPPLEELVQVAPQGGIYNYFHSLLPPLSLAPFMPRTPLPAISLFFKGLHYGSPQCGANNGAIQL
ncbi:hypothetical protein NLB58_05270 [Porphyromonas gingivalis]|uniref:hypothetical protein n=1 Tax=Porphyromonas gingivalis TaxID=837 RepID=UPI002731EC71|nr:hypothetical protein [Porphyromonas gingivalis]MDP0531264.1 hypothetical protein [Porphyromonas gingivalis]